MICNFVDRYNVSEELSTLKMEAVDASEMFVSVYRTTGHLIPEDSTISIIVMECYNSSEIQIICVRDWWSWFTSQFQHQELHKDAFYCFP